MPQLVHAAARGTAPDFSALRGPAYVGDGFDMRYVRDCARAAADYLAWLRAGHDR